MNIINKNNSEKKPRIDEIKIFLSKIEKEYSNMFEELMLAEWNSQNTGKKEDFEKLKNAKIKFNTFFSDKNKFETLKTYKKINVKDDSIKRQIILIYNEFLSRQGPLKLLNKISILETETGMIFNKYRAEIKGKIYTDNELKKILKNSVNEQELRNAWESNKKQGALVEKKLVELVKLRNKLAKDLGFNNYYEFGLIIQEQKPEEIKKITDELAKKSEKTWIKTKNKIDTYLSKRLKIKKQELKPWHYQDFFFQDPIEIEGIDLDQYYKKNVLETGTKFFEKIGLTVKEIINDSDMYERPGKCQHAFAIDINRKGDVRTLNNIKNNEKWMSTLLHELGHCIYWKHMNPKLPYLLRDTAHTFVTEAIAMYFGRYTHKPEFIEQYYGKIDEKTKKKILDSFKTAMLIATRWMIVMIEFERELYKNPEQNLNLLWWKKVKKYQHIKYSRNKPDWASKIHFVIAPVYYHNYLLGEILASQIQNKTEKEKQIGKFLKQKIFDEGKQKHWHQLIKENLGEELTTKYFEKQFL